MGMKKVTKHIIEILKIHESTLITINLNLDEKDNFIEK